ncbi:hypothetical protein [Flavobacterium sp. SM2513]|uniref:hypothetical protein n=1 Tax=Flavobacterium sp. SM2513 TaxID=3424766 RepID=UPI003D7FD0FA
MIKFCLTFLILLFSIPIFGQSNFVSLQREFCEIKSEDEIHCKVVLEKINFEINNKKKTFVQIGENRKALFKIDSEFSDIELGIFGYNVISATGDTLKFTFEKDNIRMQSISYPNTYVNFKIRK